MKQKNGSKKNPLKAGTMAKAIEKLIDPVKPTYVITKADVKDDFCKYTYEITDGIGKGDKHKVDGTGIVKDTLLEAFRTFHVHLAAVDEIFKHSNTEIKDIDKFHNHDFAELYKVTGFEVFGSGESESIMLIGNKFISCIHGRHEIKTGRIPMDNLSSYKWYNELKSAADAAREEVRLYKEGNYTPVNEDADDDDGGAVQLTIGSTVAMNETNDGEDDIDGKPSPKELMGDFDKAKV